MSPRHRSILLVIIAAVVSTLAQFLFKYASKTFSFSLYGTILNIPLIMGFMLYASVAFIFLYALKGGELTVLYPLMATSYIGVAIFSPLLFATDSLNLIKIAGTIVIILGIYFIGKGMDAQ